MVEDGMSVGDVVTIGGHVTVKGMVDGDVVIVAGSVTLGPNAIVTGDVVSVGGTIEKDEGAEVHGSLVEVNIPGISSLTEVSPFVNIMNQRYYHKTFINAALKATLDCCDFERGFIGFCYCRDKLL